MSGLSGAQAANTHYGSGFFISKQNREVNKNGVLNCIWGGIDNGIVRFAH
jgi:hypothetical protein